MFCFGQENIVPSLKSITTITDLDLSGNEFGDKIAEAWALPSAKRRIIQSIYGGPAPHVAGPLLVCL